MSFYGILYLMSHVTAVPPAWGLAEELTTPHLKKKSSLL
jgi:hypothetical protein